MDSFIYYEDKKLPYSIITNKKLKNLYITIDPLKGVVVKNPNFPIKKVQEIVEQKAKWIFEKTKLLQSKNSIQSIYQNENKVLLFGKKETLHVSKDLAHFYKEKTKEIIPSLVEQWSIKMNLFPSKITYRKTKRRWGSCSVLNELCFTSSLSQLPLSCIEYIVVHELSHIKYKHHQKSFWLHVENFMPQFKEYEKEIKLYSPNI